MLMNGCSHFVELHRWAGDTARAERQTKVNERLRTAVRAMEKLGVRLGMGVECH